MSRHGRVGDCGNDRLEGFDGRVVLLMGDEAHIDRPYPLDQTRGGLIRAVISAGMLDEIR